MTRFPRTVLLALLLAIGAIAQAVTVVPLNDTGQSLCYDSAGTVIGCVSSGLDDGRYGRDAAASVVGQLSKVGAGAAGFDFTKIANDGSVLVAGAVLSSSPSDWACTKDNVTGLTWEVKTTSGLRSSAHTYTWYSTDSASNGGNPGDIGTNTCAGTLLAYSNQCNTANYVAAVNATSLCGFSDWRLPSIQELGSINDYGHTNPTIDPTYFPNTPIFNFWSASSSAYPSASYAWLVSFYYGGAGQSQKAGTFQVRLVRSGQ